jgi:hypothetical protein
MRLENRGNKLRAAKSTYAAMVPATSPTFSHNFTLYGGFMSRKHYIMLARVLTNHNASFELCAELAGELKKDNPNFDIELFLAVCDYPSSDYLLPV